MPGWVETAGLGGREVVIGNGRGSVVGGEVMGWETVVVGEVMGWGTVVAVVVMGGDTVVCDVAGVSIVGTAVVRAAVVRMGTVPVGIVGDRVVCGTDAVGSPETVGSGVAGAAVMAPVARGVQVEAGVALSVPWLITCTVWKGVGVYTPPVYAPSPDLVVAAVIVSVVAAGVLVTMASPCAALGMGVGVAVGASALPVSAPPGARMTGRYPSASPAIAPGLFWPL